MRRREQKKREESERSRDFSKKGEKEFKGLREQMANCTRVSQPGSKSVLCIRTGVGRRRRGGRRKEEQETGRGHGGSWAMRSGLESVPLGDVSTRPSEHVFPVLHLSWSTLPR